MHYLKRLATLSALALAAMAITAASGSAVVKDATLGGTATGTTTAAYNGTFFGTENGPVTIGGVTCTSSDVSGSMDGGNNTADLSFTFANCSAGQTACTVGSIDSVSWSVAATGGGPDGTFTQAENFGTTITCLGVFVCSATSTTTAGGTAGTGPVTAAYNSTAATLTINDQLQYTGAIDCSDPTTWSGVYAITATTAPATLEIW